MQQAVTYIFNYNSFLPKLQAEYQSMSIIYYFAFVDDYAYLDILPHQHFLSM
jgi:hypothetical protein